MLRGVGLQAPALPAPRTPDETSGAGFAEKLGKTIAETTDLVGQAESSAASMASGGADSIETILSLSRAELALRHVVTVRNRVLEAYQEVMRLPL